MSVKYVTSIFVATLIGVIISPCYGAETIWCDGFESCPTDDGDAIVALTARINSLETTVAALESQTDKMLFTFSSDQTTSSARFLGMNSQSNQLNDVAVVSPIVGTVTELTFSIGQNIVLAQPESPGAEESVEVYVGVVPYNSSSYGTPNVSATSFQNFLDATGAPTPCSDSLVATDSTHVPVGTQLGLLTVLGPSTHAASCTEARIAVNTGDLITVWVRPNGFTSFKPRVTLVLEED